MRKAKAPVKETVETPEEEVAPVKSFNICHDCDTTGLVGSAGEEKLCPRCLGKGKLGV